MPSDSNFSATGENKPGHTLEAESNAVPKIMAEGHVSTSKLRIIFGGIVLGLMALGGLAVMLIGKDDIKDVWVILGPIISAGLVAMLNRDDRDRPH